MIEWFTNLSEGWQIAIFGAGATVALMVLGGLFKLIKLFFKKKDDPATQQTENEVKHLQNFYQSIKLQINLTVNIDGRAKMPDEIKEILTEGIDQEKEND